MANRYYNTKTGKFNRSRILKDAWANLCGRNNLKLRLSLALSVVWAAAKAEKKDALFSACMNEAQQNVVRLENAIEMTNYLPFGMSQSRRIEALQTEIGRLAA
ncbi:MAG: hypothetical protein COB78_10810 [Hyphomicrobiales bacterium]|nr:MAG: hypothetical protein COB78_10810 [Hyphomicrobiales bacterium]